MTLWEFICEVNSIISLSAIELDRITAAIDMMVVRMEIKARPQKLQADWSLDEGSGFMPYAQEGSYSEADKLAAQKLAVKVLREAAANGLIVPSPVATAEYLEEEMALGP
jgi:hypothetical protein